MAQRHSEYTRMPGDLYVTPRWVYEALYDVEQWAERAWDCAPVNSPHNFLEWCSPIGGGVCVATNPPFSLADAFCRHAINECPRVAMLLPYSFDAAKTRRDLWEHPFKARYNLTRRIRWENLEQKKAGPSQNHAWFVWDMSYTGKPFIGWLPLLDNEEAA